ncbi:MAG TPA: hypothetical protein VM491_03720 [Burkholderiaceae bacterium]|jgi:type VI protein secretion system component VasF|nr:hypothetical protein [Burkholderiaceae bacterium]
MPDPDPRRPPRDLRAARRTGIRITAAILVVVVLMFFFGIMLRQWLNP